jgi:hypothetical protein
MAIAARWNLVVSNDTDVSLRQYLTSVGGGRKGDLSKFVEQAVREKVFFLTAKSIREGNSIYAPADIENAVDEALTWARKRR